MGYANGSRSVLPVGSNITSITNTYYSWSTLWYTDVLFVGLSLENNLIIFVQVTGQVYVGSIDDCWQMVLANRHL